MAKTANQIINEARKMNVFTFENVKDLIIYAYQQGKESTIVKPVDDPKFEECIK